MKARTTLELDGELLERAMQLSQCRTKTELIELALRELVRQRQLELFLDDLRHGDFEPSMTIEEFEASRRSGREKARRRMAEQAEVDPEQGGRLVANG